MSSENEKGSGSNDIVHLNVGGTRFSTSRHTLLWNGHSFFTGLLNGRIQSLKDENGAIFIDRDPRLFGVILNYLRTRDLHFGNDIDISAIRNEAEYYGLFSLVQKLTMCEDYYHGPCGDLLFHGYIEPPLSEEDKKGSQSSLEKACTAGFIPLKQEMKCPLNKSSTFMGQEAIYPLKVNLIKCHHNWMVTAFANSVCVYKLKEIIGWRMMWSSPTIADGVALLAINARAFATGGMENSSQLVALVTKSHTVILWSINDEGGTARKMGQFSLRPESGSARSSTNGAYAEAKPAAEALPIDDLFFVGGQLVALSRHAGRVGIWHGMTQQWRSREVVPITSYDVAGTEYLVLGCENGSIYYIDMQKFPLRMKDNDLLVNELFKDPTNDSITALSVYVTPRTSMSGGNWLEIAYGTSSGNIRIIVQHPETVCQGPVAFQSFSVHRGEVVRVVLAERVLVSMCSQDQHVRTWSTTRFRGMISTQPGSMPLASFHLMTVPNSGDNELNRLGNDPGPYGDREEQLMFVQKVMPETDQLLVRFASHGKRICTIRSVDGSFITSFTVHECDGSSRITSRPRRFLFTGHSNGSIQIWDLTTALESIPKEMRYPSVPTSAIVGAAIGPWNIAGGPTPRELVRLMGNCELGPAFRPETPLLLSPSASSYWRNDCSHSSCYSGSQQQLVSLDELQRRDHY